MIQDYDIIVYKKDNNDLILHIKYPHIVKEIDFYFSKRADGYKFMPAYKNGFWDGYIHFFNKSNYTISIGLKNELEKFFIKQRYKYKFDFNIAPELKIDDLEHVISSFQINENYKPRDYQIKAFFDAVNERYINIESPTGSGKSLIIYLIVKYMLMKKRKTIIIVPQLQLCEQLYKDFKEYGFFEIDKYISIIYSGKEKNFDKQIIISTWQSIYKNRKKYLKNINCLIIDEAHSAKASEIQKISKDSNAEFKIGFSGSFHDENTTNYLSVMASLGPIKKYTTYTELKNNKYISEFKIINVILSYSNEDKNIFYNKCKNNYQLEIEYLFQFSKRNEFILKIAKNVKKNSIFLFTRKEQHGYILKELFENNITNKKIYYIDGDTPLKERELIRKEMEERDDIILLASYGTFSQGINIKNIHNLVLCSNYKSKIKVIQSIGRSLRKNQNKEKATIIDIVDNMSIKELNYHNFMMIHFFERLKIYKNNEFDYENKIIKI